MRQQVPFMKFLNLFFFAGRWAAKYRTASPTRPVGVILIHPRRVHRAARRRYIFTLWQSSRFYREFR